MGDVEAVPVREGLFENVDGGRLLGSECMSCGRVFFPRVRFCFDCLGKEMKDVTLSRRGKLYSYTFGRMASTHFQPPYAVGLIDLPEGVRVFAPLETRPDEVFRIGMEMELVIGELWRENDQSVIGYKFTAL